MFFVAVGMDLQHRIFLNERCLEFGFQSAVVGKYIRENFIELPSFFYAFGNDGVDDSRGHTGTAVLHLIVDQLHSNPSFLEFYRKGCSGQA